MTILVDVIELSKLHCEQPIRGKLAYATTDNFSGQILDGYHPDALDICLLTPEAANALCKAQNHLVRSKRLGLFIHDSYRPKRAVMDLLRWASEPAKSELELIQKAKHYPRIEKNQLFPLRYLSEDSNHCYGNTVDLVLYDPQIEKPLDMGTIFDYMDEKSHLSATAKEIGDEAYQNRLILIEAMTLANFQPYEKEHWHYSHGGLAGREVSQPFDLEITPDLKGSGLR